MCDKKVYRITFNNFNARSAFTMPFFLGIIHRERGSGKDSSDRRAESEILLTASA